MDKAKPFVRWVGGKRSILDELLSRVPKSYTEYYESFLGGGILFLTSSLKLHFYLTLTSN